MNGSGMGRHTVISEQPCVGALEADGLAVEVVVVDDHSDQLGVFVRVAKPLREGDACGEVGTELFADGGQHGGVDDSGGDGTDADSVLCEVSGCGEGQGCDPTFGGGVGRLADLSVEGRHRRGVDDDATLAVLVGVGLRNGFGRDG